ncbi:energy transducer TonB [Ignatzschineria sp. LJL83]
MNNGNKITAIMAILCVSLVHAGAFIGLSSADDSEMVMMQEGDASHLMMHQFQLSGTVEETDGNAEDSAMESEKSIAESKEEIIEELSEEVVTQPEPIVEPEIIPELEPESKPEPEKVPEEAPEPNKEPQPEVVATKAPSETKVEPPKVVEKPQAQVAPKTERTPQRQQPKTESTTRVVQTAKLVYSESEVSVLNKPMPSYPRAAMQRRMQGTVELLVGVNESGAATAVKVARSSGHNLLDKTAVKTAYGIRLKPFKVNGVAIPIQVKIQYQFKL